MMLTTNTVYSPDILEIVNLFEGCEGCLIEHVCSERDGGFENLIKVDGREFCYFDKAEYSTELERKRYQKRFAKLSAYKALCSVTGKVMPWGALTGIRPVKLAYQHGEGYKDFLREVMQVSSEKVDLVDKIVHAQRGIYEIKAGNCDFFVGIPFCPTRCAYCSFVSSEIAKAKNLPDYVDALVKEINAAKPLVKNLRSIYVGGGTPVSLPKEMLRQVLQAIGKNTDNIEYTVEAGRPDCIDRECLELLKEYGVNRICVNPQTFNDQTLVLLGRRHTAEDIFEKFALAREYGFDINMDLIAGLTGESFEMFKYSLDTALSLRPENITVHTLCLKKGSKLKESTERLSDGAVPDMVDYACKTLCENGYAPYYLYRQKYMAANLENTGYALPGKACVYNVDIMEEICDNIACGANAVSKAVFPDENRIERYGAPKDIKTYVDKIDVIVREKNKLFDKYI